MKPSSKVIERFIRGAACFWLFVGLSGGAFVGCSDKLPNSCEFDQACEINVGPGTTCQSDGFCSAPGPCETGHDCRKQYGAGMCFEGHCVAPLHPHPQCDRLYEPSTLRGGPVTGPYAPILIGGIFPTGDAAGMALAESVRLAVAEINEKGGRMNNGQTLGAVICNIDVNNTIWPELTNRAVDYLAGELGVTVIIGPRDSPDAQAAMARIEEKKYPTVVISPSATSPGLTDVYNPFGNDKPGLFWRTCPNDLLQAEVMATRVIGMDPSVSKVAVIYSTNPFVQGLSTLFRDLYGANKVGMFPVSIAQFTDGKAMTNLANQINMYAPDGIFVIAENAKNSISVVNALADTPAGQAKFFFVDKAKDAAVMFDPTLSPNAQSIIAASRGTAIASPSGDLYQTFLAAFNEKVQGSTSAYSFTAHAYDATYVGAYGIIWASRMGSDYDGYDVSAGILQLSAASADTEVGFVHWPNGKAALANDIPINFRGASGKLDYDSYLREAPGDIEIWTASGGKFTTQEIVSP